jgi:hypothetical protein
MLENIIGKHPVGEMWRELKVGPMRRSRFCWARFGIGASAIQFGDGCYAIRPDALQMGHTLA